MGSGDATGFLECDEVPASGGFGDFELGADFLEGEVSAGGQQEFEFISAVFDDVAGDFHGGVGLGLYDWNQFIRF